MIAFVENMATSQTKGSANEAKSSGIKSNKTNQGTKDKNAVEGTVKWELEQQHNYKPRDRCQYSEESKHCLALAHEGTDAEWRKIAEKIKSTVLQKYHSDMSHWPKFNGRGERSEWCFKQMRN